MMDVATIEMDSDAAREKLRAYRTRKHADAEQDYAATIKLLEAVADGSEIINVGDAIAFGEFDDAGRPMLALARADRKQVQVTRDYWSREIVFDCSARLTRSEPGLMRSVTRHHLLIRDKSIRGYATVPMVPAEVRPATGQLRQWWILWEVEQWSDRPIVDPPYDPLLLEHIEGDFYKILGHWDLTELERAAMQLAAFRNA